jgi:hypothetical protein
VNTIEVAPEVRIPTDDLVKALCLVIDENEMRPFHRKKLKKKIKKNAERGGMAAMDLPPEWSWRICVASLCLGNLHWWGWETRSEVIWDLCTRPWFYPRWNGHPTDLYLVAEQGVGDEIIFSNAYQKLIDKNPDLTIECDSRLIPAFERTFKAKFESRWKNGVVNDPLPLDVQRGNHAAFMPAGNALKYAVQDKTDFVDNWIVMDEKKTQWWRNWLKDYPKPHVGVSWVGRQGTLDPKIFVSRGTLFNLNYEGTKGFVQPDFFDFDDMWHFISALDRVDSVTNSTIHMSGSIGIETNVIKTAPMYGEVNNRLQWHFGDLSRYFYPRMTVYGSAKEYENGTSEERMGSHRQRGDVPRSSPPPDSRRADTHKVHVSQTLGSHPR